MLKPPPPPITCIGCNHTDCTITFAIGSTRWKYWLANTSVLNALLRMSHYSAARALARAKLRATRTQRQHEPHEA